MTLISMIYGNGQPVIISDRAISDANFIGKVILPTTGKEPQTDTNVVEFRVKSLILKNILCISFAGRVSEIERVYDNLVDFYLYRDVNTETLKEFLAEINHGDDISVLYALGGSEFKEGQVLVIYRGNWLKDNSNKNLDIIACGTGASEWITHFVEYQNYLSPSGDRSVDCKHRALLACIKYISKEMQSTEQLESGWGGGFDIIYYADGQFHRYDNVAYVFLYAKEQEDFEETMLVSINHNKYEDGNAIVLNIDRFHDHSFNIIHQFRNLQNVSRDELIMACKSSDVATCIFIKKKNGTSDALVVLMKEWDPQATPLLFAMELEGTLRFAFKETFMPIIKEALNLHLN